MASPPLTVAEMLSDTTTLLSLSLVVALLSAAYLLSTFVLSRSTPKSLRLLFIWHVFDFLIHLIFEGSFLYNCLFTYISLPAAPLEELTSSLYTTLFTYISPAPSDAPQPVSVTNWLGHTDRLYGANFAGPDNPFAALWRVYAQADYRWGGADANVVSIELLTVLGAGPLAALVAWMIARRNPRAGIWMIVLAVGELYGGMCAISGRGGMWGECAADGVVGFMTFAPEWLTGSQNLDTSNWVYTYVPSASCPLPTTALEGSLYEDVDGALDGYTSSSSTRSGSGSHSTPSMRATRTSATHSTCATASLLRLWRGRRRRRRRASRL